jgi:hypothetical protein
VTTSIKSNNFIILCDLNFNCIIRGYLTLHLKILVRNDMDVNEHQGLSNITLKNISKERYGCKGTSGAI